MTPEIRCPECHGLDPRCPECQGSGVVQYREPDDGSWPLSAILIWIFIITVGIAFWWEFFKTIKLL